LGTEGRTYVRGRRRCEQLLDDLKEMRGYRKLKKDALDHTVENSFWKNLQICHKTDYRVNKYKQGKKVVEGD
jgi:hypothetical protein